MKSQLPMPPQRLDLAGKTCSDRIVSREPAEAWAAVNLEPLWAGDAAPQRR